MPYYIYCIKCNENGSYDNVDLECGKCCSTGNDWREDRELEDYHQRFNVSLEELKQKRVVQSSDGTKLFYADEIPSIEEEKALLKRFKPKIDNSEHEKALKRKDFDARLMFFVKNFYLDGGGLDMQSPSYSGNIDRVSLYISFFGINTSMIDKVKTLLSEIENNESDFHTQHETSELLKKYPKLNMLYEMQEVMSHEHFHLLQFLSCQSVNTFYKAVRKHHVIRVHLLSEIIRLNVKLDRNSDTNLFDAILKLNDETSENRFMKSIAAAKMETATVKNFYSYRSDKTDLDIIDIMEGSTIAFQKLVNKIDNVQTAFNEEYLQSDSKFEQEYKKYYGAWNYYKKQGGVQRVIFFIITHQSLRYGLLDDGDYMNAVPIPQDLFIVLCQNISRYENELNSLGGVPFGIDKDLSSFELDSEQTKAVYKLKSIFNLVKEDIKTYSKEVNIYHDDATFEKEITYESSYMWSPLRTIDEKIKDDYPIVKSEFFLPLLLINYGFFTKFIFQYLPKMLNRVEFQGIFQNDSDMQSDNFFLKITDDIDEYLRTSFTTCCDNHESKVQIFDLMHCDNENSLKNRYKLVSEKEFSSLFEG